MSEQTRGFVKSVWFGTALMAIVMAAAYVASSSAGEQPETMTVTYVGVTLIVPVFGLFLYLSNYWRRDRHQR